MVIRRKPVALVGTALVAGIVIGCWYWYISRPQYRIRKRFDALSARVSKQPEESTGVMAFKMHSLSELFGREVVLDFAEYAGSGRYSAETLASRVARIRPHFTQITLSFHDVTIMLIHESEAEADVTARLVAQRQSGEPNEDTREVRCTLRKMDGEWRFTAFREIEVLRR